MGCTVYDDRMFGSGKEALGSEEALDSLADTLQGSGAASGTGTPVFLSPMGPSLGGVGAMELHVDADLIPTARAASPGSPAT